MNAPNHEPKPRKPSNFDLTVDQSVSMLVHMLATEQADIALAAKILMDRTAEVIARSMVLPCDAVLNGNPVEMEKVLGKLPDPVPCLILFYRLSHDP